MLLLSQCLCISKTLICLDWIIWGVAFLAFVLAGSNFNIANNLTYVSIKLQEHLGTEGNTNVKSAQN